jgi:hypothetical protein
MPPGSGICVKRSQDGQCLGGEPGTASHGVKLYLGRCRGSTLMKEALAGRPRGDAFEPQIEVIGHPMRAE